MPHAVAGNVGKPALWLRTAMRLPTVAMAVAPKRERDAERRRAAVARGVELGQEQERDAGHAQGRRHEHAQGQALAVARGACRSGS